MEYLNEYLTESNNVEVPSCDVEPHLLISSVRKSYLKYMIRLLCENYVGWCGERPPRDVVRAARDMEMRAAAQAMLVPLYREAILSMIKSVKKHTSNKDLLPEVQEFCTKSRSRSKSTQTDPIHSTPAPVQHSTPAVYKNDQTNCKKAQNKSNKAEIEQKMLTTKNEVNKIKTISFSEDKDTILESSVPTAQQRVSKVTISSDDDNVMMEMERLFKTDNMDSEDDIFDSFMCDKQVKMILEEINQYGNNSQTPQEDTLWHPEESSDVKCNNSVGVLSLEERLEQIMKPVGCSVVSSSQSAPVKKYVYSQWPCELYYQKKKLRIKLDIICEKSLKMHAKVKARFLDLFGYDSDDEQALQSPDSSEAFVLSCRQRAAPFVARHLRPYVRKARLPAHLFKPLARHLLERLVNINQYPDDYECFLFVKEYFHHRPRIRCQAEF